MAHYIIELAYVFALIVGLAVSLPAILVALDRTLFK